VISRTEVAYLLWVADRESDEGDDGDEDLDYQVRGVFSSEERALRRQAELQAQHIAPGMTRVFYVSSAAVDEVLWNEGFVTL
jgi:hypothetical protein